MTNGVKNIPMVKSGDLIRYLCENPAAMDSQIATFRDELRALVVPGADFWSGSSASSLDANEDRPGRGFTAGTHR